MQDALFDGEAHLAEGGLVPIAFYPDFAAWQACARRLLRASIPPERIWWQPEENRQTLALSQSVSSPTSPALPTLPTLSPPPSAASASSTSSAASGTPAASAASAASAATDSDGVRSQITVPRLFVEKARSASCHSASDRWALLYSLLWRVARTERHLMQLHGDPEVVKLNEYAKAVHRDVHKMHAFVRFRAMQDPQEAGDGERFVAWFEPAHHIVEEAAPFFRRRFANMRWSILTPDRCAHWEGEGEVWFSEGVDRAAAPSADVLEDAWRTYYRSIFNPARLKVRAMLSEMPQKYWKNLPEAQLIPSLVREADRRSGEMQAQRSERDEPRCGPRPSSPAQVMAIRVASAEAGTLEQTRLEAEGCRRCPLWEPATQTVWGEGPDDARIMLVGEQPGDREDLLGRPFVGPAGQLLDRALAEAGLDRRLLYLTNTVKHFKFKSRGKRRIHDKPSNAEALACLPWLQAEIARIQPTLVVCLGATAAQAQLGRAVKMNLERGRVLEKAGGGSGPALLLTFHPSYLLRLDQGAAADEAYKNFVADLRLAGAWSQARIELLPGSSTAGTAGTAAGGTAAAATASRAAVTAATVDMR